MAEHKLIDGDSKFAVTNDGNLLFVIKADGTIERGPAFTTTDEMSLQFWEAIEHMNPRRG